VRRLVEQLLRRRTRVVLLSFGSLLFPRICLRSAAIAVNCGCASESRDRHADTSASSYGIRNGDEGSDGRALLSAHAQSDAGERRQRRGRAHQGQSAGRCRRR
jgi:hypothetical protein